MLARIGGQAHTENVFRRSCSRSTWECFLASRLSLYAFRLRSWKEASTDGKIEPASTSCRQEVYLLGVLALLLEFLSEDSTVA